MTLETEMPDPVYVYVWSFDVAPEHAEEFEQVYGEEGAWTELFRNAAGYRSTRLLRDRERAGRYLTVDAWESAKAFEVFQRAHGAEFEVLDQRCEELTARETPIGRFDVV